jgi:hypothetical protein
MGVYDRSIGKLAGGASAEAPSRLAAMVGLVRLMRVKWWRFLLQSFQKILDGVSNTFYLCPDEQMVCIRRLLLFLL